MLRSITFVCVSVDVGPQNITVGCWELNMNMSLLRSFSSIPLLYFEGLHNESLALRYVMSVDASM